MQGGFNRRASKEESDKRLVMKEFNEKTRKLQLKYERAATLAEAIMKAKEAAKAEAASLTVDIEVVEEARGAYTQPEKEPSLPL